VTVDICWATHDISSFPSDTLTMLDMGCTTWGPRTNRLTKSKVCSSRDSMWRDILVGYGMDFGPTSSSRLLSWDTVIVLAGNWNNPEVECSESLGTEAPCLLQGWVEPDWIRRRDSYATRLHLYHKEESKAHSVTRYTVYSSKGDQLFLWNRAKLEVS